MNNIERHQSAVQMVSFNAWALPIWLPGHDHSIRYGMIPQKLIDTGADIICIQEAFADSFRRELLSTTSDHYNTCSNFRCNRSILGLVKMDCYGGLMTLSKFPIIDEEFFPFPKSRNMRWEESLGAKGFLVTQIQIDRDTAYIINTHLYAGLKIDDEQHQMHQIKYMHELLANRNILSHEVFLLGDLNVIHPSIAEERSQPRSKVYDYIVAEMGFMDSAPIVTKAEHTVDRAKNRYSSDKNGSQKLDYCFHRSPSKNNYHLDKTEILFAGAERISDHMGWSSTYRLTQHPTNAEETVTV